MQYLLMFLIGSGITTIFFFAISRFSEIEVRPQINKKINCDSFKPTKQSKNNNIVKVIFINDESYWIKNNAVYVAKHNNGIIDTNTIQRVDTHSLNGVELNRIMFVVDKLTEGNDDSSNTGH